MCRLSVHDDELRHLAHSQSTLPPDLVLHMQRNKVVCIHDRVNQPIQYYSKIHIAVVTNIQVQPIEQKDAEVMINVQERQLFPALFSNNEECIHKI